MIFGISCSLLFVGGTSLSVTAGQMKDDKAANNRDYFSFTISGRMIDKIIIDIEVLQM